MLAGAAACPPASRVGEGYVRVDTGAPDATRFLEEDVVFFNNEDQLIFLLTDRATSARVVTRSMIEGRRFTTNAIPLPGAPPDGGAVDLVRIELEPISRSIGGQRRDYVRTPPRCGYRGADCLFGQRGDDRLRGGRGPDALRGGPGADLVRGGAGDDLLVGGFGGDVLLCGDGRDRAVAGPRDRVRGCEG